MFCRKEIIFRKHTVLKAVDLQTACNTAIELEELKYSNWSDGILHGVNLQVNQGQIVVYPGIILYRKKMYHMIQNVSIPYEAKKKEMKLFIRFSEGKETASGKIFETDLVLDENIDARAGEIEIARFCLQDGAMLRDGFKDFADTNTKYNTINYWYAKHAGIEQETIAPQLLKMYVTEASKCNGLEDVDIAFIMECGRNENINRNSIMLYIQYKLKKIYQNPPTNMEIYHDLNQILQKLRNAKNQSGRIAGRRIMIE